MFNSISTGFLMVADIDEFIVNAGDSTYTTSTVLYTLLLGHPTYMYMSADLYFTTDSFFLSFCFCQLPADVAERNSTTFGHMVGRKCSLKMHVQNLGYPFPIEIGAQNQLFGDFAT